ncbi:hypothetical protein J2853_001127 [Streptosporangium lutulentum]|uniref:Uncharacterized protein n=1 Tax=Streptosporangium lutulentum TaxID=1461250 RepID=A0ABT9Q5A1_9ACTN|nr:hypothetical protein [Streptosporangium lutulentum]MDP9841916.1 hypothetical protein [Streptosporangium lutulentum]
MTSSHPARSHCARALSVSHASRASSRPTAPSRVLCGIRPSVTTSATVMSTSADTSWATTARRRATSRRGSSLSRHRSSRTVPAFGGSRPARTRSKVDFPHPLGPSRPVKPPRGMAIVIPSMMGAPPAAHTTSWVSKLMIRRSFGA